MYAVAEGHDVALGSLVTIAPQPRCPGLQAADRSYAADGSVYEQGAFVRLIWDVFGTPTEYTDVLALFGLSDTVLRANVTVYVRNANFAWQRCNGVALHPRLGVDGEWRTYFARGFTIYVKELVGLEEP